MGLSQEDVSKEIFVSRQTISNWETGKTYPDVQSLLLLSNLFGVSIDSIVKGDVETMEIELSKESRKLKHLSWTMICSFIAAIVSGMFAIILRDVGKDTSFGMSYLSLGFFALSVILLICLVGSAFWAESIKKRNNLVTYSEVLAFEKGQSVEDVRNANALGRKHPTVKNALLILAGGAVGFVAVALFQALAKMLRDYLLLG